MIPQAMEVLGVLVRWLHIASTALLIGGVAFARFIAVPALQAIPEPERAEVWDGIAWRFRAVVYPAIAGLIVSGIYNFLIHPGHSPFYHALFGIKVLLAVHVFAASILVVKEPKPRRMTGVVISGLLVILIAAYLRRIF
jgi:uncharacterized membrane protein